MATVKVTIGKLTPLSVPMTPVPIFAGSPATESITSSGTSASGALVAGVEQVAQIYCASAVIANQGAAASASAGLYCPAGVPSYLAMTPGNSVTVIDA